MPRTEVDFKDGAINEISRRTLENLPDGNYMVTVEKHPVPEEPKTSYVGGPMSKDDSFKEISRYMRKYVRGRIKMDLHSKPLFNPGLLKRILKV